MTVCLKSKNLSKCLHRFMQQMIRLRLSLGVFREAHGLSLNQLLKAAQIDWFPLLKISQRPLDTFVNLIPEA